MDPLNIFKNHLLISGLFFKEVYFSLPMNVYKKVVSKGFECKGVQILVDPFYIFGYILKRNKAVIKNFTSKILIEINQFCFLE